MLSQQAQAIQHTAPLFTHANAALALHQGQPVTMTITGNPLSYAQAHPEPLQPVEYAPDPVDDYNATWGMIQEEEPPQ